MTREDFYDRVTTWGDLLNVASEFGYEDEFEEIVDGDYVCERIQSRANDIGYGSDWESFADWVAAIPRGDDYLLYNDEYDEFSMLGTRDFDNRRDRLLEMLLDDDEIEEDDEIVDDEYIPDDDTDCADEPDDEDDYTEPEEAFPVDRLVSMCYADIRVIHSNQQAGEQSERREFDAKLTQMFR